MELMKSFSLITSEGTEVAFSETISRETVILSLRDNQGVIMQTSLNKEMFDALWDVRYKISVLNKDEAA